jgi:glucan exporter ATP-binding protein
MRFLKMYGRVLGMLRHEWRLAMVLTVANAAIAGIGFVDPVLFGRVIDMLTHSAEMPTDALWSRGTWLLGTWTGLGILGIVASMVVSVLADRMSHRARARETSAFYAHALGMPLSFHAAGHSGGLMRIFYAGGDAMFGLWLGFFREQLVTFVSILVLLPMTVMLNWRMSVALVILTVLFGAMTALVVNRTQERQRSVEKFHTALAGTAHDAMANVAVVQSFRRLAAERQNFSDLAQQAVTNQLPVLNWWAAINIMARSASTLAVLSVVVLGTVLHLRGQASVGDIVSFMGFSGLLIGRMEGLVWFVARLFPACATLEEFFAVTDARSSVPEASNAVELPAGSGEVAFESVSFAYPGGPAILSDVSFKAMPGTVTALVGQTGAGKSTAMNLLQRMWDPSMGRVSINGHDIRSVTLDSLRTSVGVVFQDSMLFNRSIRDNLLVGKPDASQEEIESACRLAEAHEFIVRQPQGYETLVGERGATLSGGQKQRLAIARALLKDPPILVLDEATSALDAATEAKVTKALKALMAGRTTFVVAHRLSTIKDADEIMVFDAGRIVERGGFDTLVRQGGRFAELVASQLSPPSHSAHTLERSQTAEAEGSNVIHLADRVAA